MINFGKKLEWKTNRVRRFQLKSFLYFSMVQEEKVAVSRCWWVRIASVVMRSVINTLRMAGHDEVIVSSIICCWVFASCCRKTFLNPHQIGDTPKLTIYIRVCLCIYVGYSHICNNKPKKQLYIEYQWGIVNYYHYIVCSHSKAFSKKIITVDCQKKVHNNVSKNFIQISNTWTENQRQRYKYS